jgi:hypothetical protein
MLKKAQHNYQTQLSAFSAKDRKELLLLSTPALVQDYINAIPFNFEKKGETCKSPLVVLETQKAHCMEGAMLAVFILGLHGIEGKLLHLQAVRPDDDHVIVVFKQGDRMGALSKTNHGVLRYREPVYKSVRELAMSYFHEYFLHTGEKTLRAYSRPVSLLRRDMSWVTSSEDLWHIDALLDTAQHFQLMSKQSEGVLRKAEPIEIAMGKIVQYHKN